MAPSVTERSRKSRAKKRETAEGQAELKEQYRQWNLSKKAKKLRAEGGLLPKANKRKSKPTNIPNACAAVRKYRETLHKDPKGREQEKKKNKIYNTRRAKKKKLAVLNSENGILLKHFNVHQVNTIETMKLKYANSIAPEHTKKAPEKLHYGWKEDDIQRDLDLEIALYVKDTMGEMMEEIGRQEKTDELVDWKDEDIVDLSNEDFQDFDFDSFVRTDDDSKLLKLIGDSMRNANENTTWESIMSEIGL